jgi:hypothetical protein
MSGQQSELRRSDQDDGMEIFFMRSIIVDGIAGINSRDYGYQFYTIKNDYWESDELALTDLGYVDDSDDAISWESPYHPVPRRYGEIDEEMWLREGVIVGKNQVVW